MNGTVQNQKKKLPKWVKILLIIFFIIIFVAVVVDSGDETSDETRKNGNSDNITTRQEKFTLIESYNSDESNQYFYYIEGKIQNNRDKEYDYVQIVFNIFDKDDNMIGTCMDNNSGLNANGTWKFKAICDYGTNDVARYELKEITGW